MFGDGNSNGECDNSGEHEVWSSSFYENSNGKNYVDGDAAGDGRGDGDGYPAGEHSITDLVFNERCPLQVTAQ